MEVELHSAWITKKIFISGQGKPGHLRSPVIFWSNSLWKAPRKKKGILSHFQCKQCSNRPIDTELLSCMGLIPVHFSVSFLPVVAMNSDCPHVPPLGGKSILAQLLKTKGLRWSFFGNTPGAEEEEMGSLFTNCSLLRASRQYRQHCIRAKAVCKSRIRWKEERTTLQKRQ